MDSQKLLRNIFEMALSADLEKNEYRALLALLNQTLGYGKRSDPLTMGRIAKLTGIRKDRVGKALSGLIDKGIFERKEHKYFDYTYSIPAKFFDGKPDDRFFAPSIPLSGNDTQSVEIKTRSVVAYRDTPLQRLTNTETNTEPASEAQSEKTEDVCNVNESPVEKIEKPMTVEAETYRSLLPSLKTLKAKQANEVLQLVALATEEGSIKTSQIRLGGGLIRAAKNGQLDTSRLEKQKKAEQRRLDAEAREREWEARQRASEAQHLAMLERLSNRIDSEKTGARK